MRGPEPFGILSDVVLALMALLAVSTLALMALLALWGCVEVLSQIAGVVA